METVARIKEVLGSASLALALLGMATSPVASADVSSPGNSGELIRALREQARKVNGFVAELSVRAGGASQTGTLLFLAPDHVHMDLTVSGLGDQKMMSDGRILWTITPEARLATKVDLEAVQRAWHHSLPNQAGAIRDVFDAMKPGTVRFVKEEAIEGVKAQLFEGVPEIGLDLSRNPSLPDRVRAWVGEDGLLRRQVLMKGGQVQMDATFRITDKNPRIVPGLFKFDPPSDYQVQDLTESTIKALQSLQTGSN